MDKIPKIGVIGGGAAGLMAAATLLASNNNLDIHIFDKNDHLGKKVIISGGGRCNLTTGINDRNILKKKYTRGSEFLKAALSKFSPEKVCDWFEEHGVPVKNEEDNRVFPVSNDGKDVVRVFEKLFEENNVQLHLNKNVLGVEKKNNQYIVKTKQTDYPFDYLIITTGGNAYSQTGSTGDGYAFAKTLGHSITDLGPSLNSFEVKEDWVKELSGLSLENVTLSHDKLKSSGPFLFTHFGISGPVTFALSSQIAFSKISPETPLEISITPFADKDFAKWDKELQELFMEHKNKTIKNVLSLVVPQRLADTLILLSYAKENEKCSQASKSTRQSISKLLSGELKITLINRRPGDEFVTAGGVNTDEINPQTMESEITPNLYFAGEIMNVDGVTGGFNLQASWAAGSLAGKSIAKKVK